MSGFPLKFVSTQLTRENMKVQDGNDSNSPDISVVIFTPDNFTTIRKTIECLRNQTLKHRMEVVIVVPSKERLNLDSSKLIS